MRLISGKYSFLMLVTFGIACVGGCTPPDHWPVFAEVPDLESQGDTFTTPKINPVEFKAPATEPPVVSTDVDIPVELSVEQAVMFALRNNRDLQVQQLEPVVFASFEQIERGQFDPELFAEAEYFDERSIETSRSSGASFDVTGNDSIEIAGIRQFLPTGTTLEATVAHDRSTSNRAPEQQTARLGLSVTQALLRGFGPSVNLANVRQARLDTLASINELRGFTEALLADTEIAYWLFVLAREEIAIFKESLEIARQQLEEVDLRIEVGILPEIEAAAAKAEEALRVQNLIDARSQLEDRRLRLLRLISPGPDEHLERQVTTTSEPRIEPQPITNLAERLQLAEQSRPDLIEARLRLQRNRLETIVTRNGLLPKLDLFIALGKTGYADTFSEAFQELDSKTRDYTVGLRLNHYLGNRVYQGRNLAANATHQQAVDAVANLLQLVHLDVRLAANQVERTRQQIDATRTTRTFQEQTLNAEKERFDVGASTSLQVAQAQRDLLRIQIAEIEAIINYRIALVRLFQAEGSMLDRRGVTVSASDYVDLLGSR